MTIDSLRASLADRYTIERELGAGGMATVYLAHDIKHDRKVAIKVLKPELAAVLGAERFIQEIKTTAALSHPHILPLFDSGTCHPEQPALSLSKGSGPEGREVEGPRSLLYYVMPYIQGETIREKLNRETQFGVDEAVKITTEVADALDYAHRHGVIHRDIKPENILLHDGRPMVMDFGIALAVSAAAGGRKTETGLSLGTPHYMSPEQATADKTITARSDIYSLGAVLYEMLAGEPPHTGAGAQQVIMKIVTDGVAPVTKLRKSVPPNVAAAVGKALEKLPADRFATAKEFEDALANPMFTTVIATAASPANLRAIRSWLRSPWSWAALAATGVATVFAVFAARRDRGDGTPTFTPETFTARSIFDARFAPDGQTIVFSATRGSGSTPHLFIIRPDRPDPEPLGPDSTQLLSISSSGVAAVLTHAGGNEHRLFTTGTLATLPLSGGAPREIAVGIREADWAPDGKTMAVVRDTNGADQLEYPIGTVIARSAGYISDLRISPSGDAVAFFEHPDRYDDRGSVSIVDRTGRPVAHSEQFWGLEGLAWRADGRSILFTGSDESYVTFTVFDLERSGGTHRFLASAGGLTMQDLSRSGQLLVTRDENPNIVMARGPGAQEATDIGVRDQSYNPLMSNDGSFVVFSDEGVFAGPNYTVLMRKTDGSPEVRLGEGEPQAISPDGKFVLASLPSKPPRLMLYPTGPGASRQLDIGTFTSIAFVSGSFAAIGSALRFTFCGARPHQGMRCFVGTTAGGAITPITPEGTPGPAVLSPDGMRVLVRVGGVVELYPAAGGTPQPARGFNRHDNLERWSPDGRDVWVVDVDDSLTMHVVRVDPETGVRAELERIVPRAHTGFVALGWQSLANDPHVYVYTGIENLSTLYLVRGVK